MLLPTDYGHTDRAFFENPKILGLGRQIGPNIFGTFVVFSAELSDHILGSMCSINQPPIISTKTSFWYQILNIYLGLAFQFGQQRIRDLAFACS